MSFLSDGGVSDAFDVYTNLVADANSTALFRLVFANQSSIYATESTSSDESGDAVWGDTWTDILGIVRTDYESDEGVSYSEGCIKSLWEVVFFGTCLYSSVLVCCG